MVMDTEKSMGIYTWQQTKNFAAEIHLIAQSNDIHLSAGLRLGFAAVTELQNSCDSMLINEIQHNAYDYAGWNCALSRKFLSNQTPQNYRNTFKATKHFLAVPKKNPPPAYYLQVCTVAKQQSEAHANTDGNYIKVKFPWSKAPEDEDQFCIKVATSIAGNNWGVQFTPAENDNVLVSFLDNNLEQGCAIGSLYSTHNPTFTNLKDKYKIGIQCNRNNSDNEKINNAVWLDNTSGKESVSFMAQKDLQMLAKNAINLTVSGRKIETIKLNYSIKSEKLLLSANKAITLQTAESKIHIAKNYLTIESKNIAFN